MKALKILCLAGVLAVAASLGQAAWAKAYGYRQYYSSWSYYPARTYYYSHYYYQPYPTYVGYRYHYTIYYPSQPRYVYYYNPYTKVYWGRYDTKEKGYSLLKKEDRKAKLDDIPQTAFPKPGPMPEIPESDDDVKMEPIDISKLPKEEKGSKGSSKE